MRSGVIGAGSMGRTLARHLTKRGHHVSMANARGPETLTALAAEGATPVAVVDAATAGDMVIIAMTNIFPASACRGEPLRKDMAAVPDRIPTTPAEI